MRAFAKITIALLYITTALHGQDPEIDRLIQSELKMTFPSVYFKHKSTDYAAMPYKIDSCLKHIALNYNKDINSLVIWRDSTETEVLTNKRIKKLRAELRKYLQNDAIEIISMEQEQKISRRTMNLTSDKEKINYLLSLNSVFDISKTRIPFETNKSHMLRPKIWCGDCWRNGFHLNKRGREVRKTARHHKQATEKQDKKKTRRHLVWTGWKTGFHWSTPK